MGKFRIENATLGIDYTPAFNYDANVVLNVCEIDTNISQFDFSRDTFLVSQMDKYNFNIFDITADEWENVFKVMVNQTVTFTPDLDNAGVSFQAIIAYAKPYYRKSNVYKDAIYLELLQLNYRAGQVLTFDDEILTFGGETLTF